MKHLFAAVAIVIALAVRAKAAEWRWTFDAPAAVVPTQPKIQPQTKPIGKLPQYRARCTMGFCRFR